MPSIENKNEVVGRRQREKTFNSKFDKNAETPNECESKETANLVCLEHRSLIVHARTHILALTGNKNATIKGSNVFSFQ